MKYRLTAAVLLQPPGSRNQESRHIRLSVLKAAVLVPPQGRDSHRKHQWGRYFQAKLEEPPTTHGVCRIKFPGKSVISREARRRASSSSCIEDDDAVDVPQFRRPHLATENNLSPDVSGGTAENSVPIIAARQGRTKGMELCHPLGRKSTQKRKNKIKSLVSPSPE
ncbi:hypothetical protein STEG23_012278, partial [Scotinomys teguina]